MPPIPIYAHSPINAAKADGVTPKTAEPGQPGAAAPPPTTMQDAPYAPAQPGAAPAIPAPTGAATLLQQHQQQSPPRPTPTQPLGSEGPPPPQPGALPVPPGASPTGPPRAISTGLPPPPQAGEAMTHGRGRGASVSSSTSTSNNPPHYPPQMTIPAPAPAVATQGAQRGTTTISAPAPALAAAPSPLEHPPGYQQDATAGELNRHQRAAQEALEREEQEEGRKWAPGGGDGEGGGVWVSVRGAVAAAGEKLASAEKDVWAKINKGL